MFLSRRLTKLANFRRFATITHPFTNTLTQAQMDSEDKANEKYLKYNIPGGYYPKHNNFRSKAHEQIYQQAIDDPVSFWADKAKEV